MVLIPARSTDDSFDSEEEDGIADQDPIDITWINFIHAGELIRIGLSTLPGCKIKESKRSVSADLETLKDNGVTDLFVFSTEAELAACGVSKMLYDCDDQGFEVHYYPLSDCDLPSTAKLLQILAEIETSSKAVGRKVCLQSPNGVGKACMVAGLFGMYINSNMTFEQARSLLQRLKGIQAIQTVKEYNYLSEFRQKLESYFCSQASCEEAAMELA